MIGRIAARGRPASSTHRERCAPLPPHSTLLKTPGAALPSLAAPQAVAFITQQTTGLVVGVVTGTGGRCSLAWRGRCLLAEAGGACASAWLQGCNTQHCCLLRRTPCIVARPDPLAATHLHACSDVCPKFTPHLVARRLCGAPADIAPGPRQPFLLVCSLLLPHSGAALWRVCRWVARNWAGGAWEQRRSSRRMGAVRGVPARLPHTRLHLNHLHQLPSFGRQATSTSSG